MVRITVLGLLLAVCIHHGVTGERRKVPKQSGTHRGPELPTGEWNLEAFYDEIDGYLRREKMEHR